MGAEMGFIEAISVTKVAIKTVGEIRSASRQAKNDHEKRELLTIIQALRRIYFTPKGIRSILMGISEGIQPSQPQIDALIEFNDAEWEVGRALQKLDLIDAPISPLSLRTQRVLSQISYGKVRLRRDIQSALNQALTYDQQVEPQMAVELLGVIQILNDAIEDADESIMQALR
ncbi:MAG: DNA-binding transcriptional MerR regulator [Paracoccaceae bacterium]